jgi:hypothetical protein
VNIFDVKIWDDERRSCTFYTVQKDGSDTSETDKFFINYEAHPDFYEDAQELLSFVLLSIGDDHGAIDAIFNRYENEVVGLPSKGIVSLGKIAYCYPNFPLRLYALKITDRIVILFNGGVKDGDTNQTSSLHLIWVEACQFARRISEAITTGEVKVDIKNRKLTNTDGTEEIVL